MRKHVAQTHFEVPDSVRQLMEKSVQQARTAFEQFTAAARTVAGSVNPTLPSGAKEVNEKAFSYAEVNIKAACDLAEKLVQAKNAQEFLQLQSEFVAAQLETLREQTNDLSSAIQNAMIWTPKP